jgi:hypothetical protein
MAASIGLVGGLGSVVGGLAGLFGGSNQPPPAPTLTNPAAYYSALPIASGAFQQGVEAQQGLFPQVGAAGNNLYNNPGAPGAISAAGTAGQLGQNAALTGYGVGGSQIGTGSSLTGPAYAALNAGFDPLNQVYNQQFQQNTDQTRALLEARGIDSTPYGAGVEAQSNLNFNNAWQQNLLARQGQGAQTAEGLLGTGANLQTGGVGLQNAAPQNYYNAGFLPYNANQQIGSNQLGVLGQEQSLYGTPAANWLSYLNAGSGATGQFNQNQTSLYNAQLAAQNQQFNQQQALGKDVGAGLQALGKVNYSQLPGFGSS